MHLRFYKIFIKPRDLDCPRLILLNLEFKVSFRIKRTKRAIKDQNITTDISKFLRNESNLAALAKIANFKNWPNFSPKDIKIA